MRLSYNINQFASKVLSPETGRAMKRIRSIIEKFEDDHGVIDVFSRYSSKDLATSMVALSRLQHASDYYTKKYVQQDKPSERLVTPELDPQLISDMAHYSVFANVAYGWMGSMAISGRFRIGNVQTLTRRTGIKGSYPCCALSLP